MLPTSAASPYHDMQPLPIPQEPYLFLQPLLTKIAFIVTLTGFCTLIGCGYAIVNAAVITGSSLIADSALWACGGIPISLFICYVMPFPNQLAQYRVDTLNQMEEAARYEYRTDTVAESPSQQQKLARFNRCKEAIETLKTFFTYPFSRFAKPYHAHMLHKELTLITQLCPVEREDIKKIWQAFLQHLHQMKIGYPSGEIEELDVSLEFEHLQRTQLVLQTGWLRTWGWFYERDLKKIEALHENGLGIKQTGFSQQLKKALQSKGSGCALARREDTGEILGYAFYTKKEGRIILEEILHKPEAACLDIGNKLMSVVLKENKGQPIQLKVSKDNPAVHLFAKWGFTVVGKLPSHYQDLKEDGLLMQIDWSSYVKLFTDQ